MEGQPALDQVLGRQFPGVGGELGVALLAHDRAAEAHAVLLGLAARPGLAARGAQRGEGRTVGLGLLTVDEKGDMEEARRCRDRHEGPRMKLGKHGRA